MKCLVISLIIFTGIYAVAEAKAPVIKSWKTFRSDVGYEFKYPDCFKIDIDDPDETGNLESIKHLAISEGPACMTPRLDPETPNGVSFEGGLGPPRTKEEALKEIKVRDSHSAIAIERKDELIFKKFKLGSDDAIAWVEFLPDVSHQDIRWDVRVYCPDWPLTISGPMIRNPDKSYYEKFKAGDLALPEPEKTIIESIRCVPAKLKDRVKKSDTLSSSKNGKK